MGQFKVLILLVCMAFSANALADLKTYDVDPSNGEEVFQALGRILTPREGVSLGSISRLPTGQLLIDTTPEMHAQIAGVLEAVSRYRAEPTPRVTLQYWVVLGSREAADAAETPEILANVLDEIKRVHGPISFRLLGSASLVSDSGRRGTTSGDLSITQTAYAQGDTLNADLAISFQMRFSAPVSFNNEDGTRTQRVNNVNVGQNTTVNMSMQRGEFVVVGENSLSDTIAAEKGVDGTIFYIVHWPAAE